MLLKKIFAYVLGDKIREMVKKKNLVMIPIYLERNIVTSVVYFHSLLIFIVNTILCSCNQAI